MNLAPFPLRDLHRWIVIAAAGTLSACAVGPDFVRPAAPSSTAYAPTPMAERTAAAPVEGGQEQRFVIGADIRADWWTVFGSPQLDALIARAIAANPSIEAANAALRVAQENVAAQRGFFFPTVGAGYSRTRTKLAGNQGGNSPGIQGNGSVIATGEGKPASEGGTAPFNTPVSYNFHTAQLTLSYAPDVFGANKRQVEALQAQAEQQRYQAEAAYITLASNIVAAAIQDAQLRQQIATVRELIEASEMSVKLVQRQLKAGHVARLDVVLQERALAQSRELLPPLQKQFELNRNLLRALAGGDQDAEVPSFEMEGFALPKELPLSLPSQLIEQRPDVRAAEAQLHEASAQIGIARAARLPQFTIDGNLGGTASHFSQMFWNSGKFFELAANVAMPIFDGGTLKARERGAREALRQSAAQYRATVVMALQSVADTLQSIHYGATSLQATADVADKAKSVMELTRRQYGRGYLDRLALIEAEQTYRQALLDVTQARATRLGDTAALFQALGGGWWHRPSTDSASAEQVQQQR